VSDLNLYSVNWQDGMLITQQHLKDQEKYFEDLARWYALDVSDRFGLVRKDFSGKPALSLNLSRSGNRLSVEVVRCQAITPDGSIIEINESNSSPVRADTGIETPVVPVYVGIDPAVKNQVGQPDPQEDLPRVPYLMSNYHLTLGQHPNLPEGRYLQVAELNIDGNEVTPSDSYYPPCLSLNADERLTQKATDFRNRLENLLSLSSRAYAAVTSGGALAGEQTTLQTAFQETIYQFANHLSSSLDDFVIGRNACHPIRLVLLFKKLFRVFTTLLNLKPGLKDFLNERFFAKEMNSEVGRFMSSVDGLLLAEYNHTNLGGHLKAIDDVLGDIRSRLERAGELSYLMIDMSQPSAMSDTVTLITKDLFSTAEWSRMQVRLGLNDARGLGETDPVEVDVVTFGDKVALRPQDMLRSPSVRQLTLIFRGTSDSDKFSNLGKMDLIVYAV
jgi:hypothetical protein